MHRRLQQCSPCNAGNDLAQPILRSSASMCPMSVPKGPHGRSSNKEFSTRAARRVAKKLMTSPFPRFLNDQFEVGKSGKRLVGY